jgi:hypothetical protein
MTDVVNELKPDEDETAPETPASPPDDDGIQALIDEFDAKVAQQPDPNGQNLTDGSTDQTFDQQLADLLGPDPKIAELQGQVDAFQRESLQRRERALKPLTDVEIAERQEWLAEHRARIEQERIAALSVNANGKP